MSWIWKHFKPGEVPSKGLLRECKLQSPRRFVSSSSPDPGSSHPSLSSPRLSAAPQRGEKKQPSCNLYGHKNPRITLGTRYPLCRCWSPATPRWPAPRSPPPRPRWRWPPWGRCWPPPGHDPGPARTTCQSSWTSLDIKQYLVKTDTNLNTFSNYFVSTTGTFELLLYLLLERVMIPTAICLQIILICTWFKLRV